MEALLAVISEQIAVLEEDLAQLYDDQFIETCAAWVVPYIGDLIGYRTLHGVTARVSSPRAEVANTIAYRRRKGTAAALEQLARDVTGWDARVVEFFQLLATSQYLNHLRPGNHFSPDLRRWELLERLDTPFDTVAHTVDVRRIASGRGRHNIPNVGIFLWRLDAYSLTGSPAAKLAERRYLFSPLGNNTPLYNRPVTEDEITHLAEPVNVPMPLSRRVLAAYLETYYGPDKSILLSVGGSAVPASQIVVCDLSDHGAGWAHKPADKYAIDPLLGRIATPENEDDPGQVVVTYHYGFSANMGGGEYDRATTLDARLTPVQRVPDDEALIQNALVALGGASAVEITNSGRYPETPNIQVSAGERIELRAADGRRPTLVLSGDMTISGGEDSEVTINGLLISGGALRVSGDLRRLRLRHCTLVPGQSLNVEGRPQAPDQPSLDKAPGGSVTRRITDPAGAEISSQPSLIIEATDVTVEIDHCILGGLRVVDGAKVAIGNSIVDATDTAGVAYAALDGLAAGGDLRIENSTVIGKVHTRLLELVSNSILLADVDPAEAADWPAPVISERRQAGCVRFSYVPWASLTPRRFRCQPAREEDSGRVRPLFNSLRYGDAAYGQLGQRCAVEIRQGADDEAEMGAFHDLYQPQRETNLRVRLEEYLRFGLEAGVFYAS